MGHNFYENPTISLPLESAKLAILVLTSCNRLVFLRKKEVIFDTLT